MPVYPLKRTPDVSPTVADWAKQFDANTELNATYVTVALKATTAIQQVPHSLGRAYRFAVLAGQSDLNVDVRLGSPGLSDDPKRFFAVKLSSATALTVTVRLA